MVRAGKRAGRKDTVRVVRAGTVTVWLTATGAPPLAAAPPLAGGAMVAVTLPVCGLDAALVMSALTVRAELARSGALCSITRELPSASGPATWSWTGNWMPVLLSGGIWFQSTSSSLNILLGLFGCTSTASEFPRRLSRRVMSKVNLAYAPVTLAAPATLWPLTHTFAAPMTPLMISFASRPARRGAAKSVRHHHGTANRATVSLPTAPSKPKHLRMLSEKKTCGHRPFCSRASISVPGAPASSLDTRSQPRARKPGLEIRAPRRVTPALLCTCQPRPPRLARSLLPVAEEDGRLVPAVRAGGAAVVAVVAVTRRVVVARAPDVACPADADAADTDDTAESARASTVSVRTGSHVRSADQGLLTDLTAGASVSRVTAARASRPGEDQLVCILSKQMCQRPDAGLR